MENFETSKILAAIGSILLFLSFTPILGVVGIVLLFFGMKGLAEHYRNDDISKNIVTGVLFGVIGFIVLAVGAVGAFSIFSISSLSYNSDALVASAMVAVALLILVFVILFVFMLLMARSFRKSFYALADHSGEHLFRTAGTLLWIGAILTIIGVGLILIWIAFLILTIAFFLLKTPQKTHINNYASPLTAQSSQTTSTADMGTNFCPNCGTSVSFGATFCSNCGKHI